MTAPPKEGVQGDQVDAPKEGAESAVDFESDMPDATLPPIDADEERPMPDYDGREDAPPTAGEVLIWIPRGLFFPVYLVTEYVIRRPVGAIVTAVEEADIPAVLTEFFTFGPGNKMGLVPSFLIDFGFRPSIGVYFFSDDLPVDHLGFRAHLAYGGLDWYRATGTVRYQIDRETNYQSEKFVQVKGIYSHRPDWLFYGIGPESLKDEEAGYTAQYIEAYARYHGGYWRSGRINGWAGITHATFRDVHSDAGPPPDKTPGIQYASAIDFYPVPPLFREGYFATKMGVDFSFDTREKRFPIVREGSDFVEPPGTGIKLAPRAELGIGLRKAPSVSDPAVEERPLWIKYGGTVGGFVDLYNQRVIGLQGIVDFIDPFDEEAQIPFTELVSLGGSRPMRGFLQNRLLGRSSAVLELEYRWPIWVFLDGMLNYSVGNVFGKHLEDFHPSLLRQSFGFGFAANASRDHNFEFLLGLGTETFDQGSSIDTFRFVIGASEGF